MKRELVLKTFNKNKAELLQKTEKIKSKWTSITIPFVVTAELTIENCSEDDESDPKYFFVDAVFDKKSSKFVKLEWDNIYEGIDTKDIEYYNIEL